MARDSSPFDEHNQNLWKDIQWLFRKLINSGKTQQSETPIPENINSAEYEPKSKGISSFSLSVLKGKKSTLQVVIAVAIAFLPVGIYLLNPSGFDNTISSVGTKVNKTANVVLSVGEQSPIKKHSAEVALQNNQSSESVRDVMSSTALDHAAKHADPNYICPMHPNILSDDPNAICPICGMDLVLLEVGGETGVVTIRPTVINTLGVRTSKAKLRTLYRRIDSVGYIDVDENNIREVSLRTEGWVEHLAFKTEGERVTKGELLFEVYSPKLVNAQEEYLQAINHENELLIKASQERLRALGVSEEQIEQLENSKTVEPLVKVFSPQSGVITRLNVREGRYVKPSQSVIDIVDLSSVWLIVDVFERQAEWVKVGQRAEARLAFLPGRSWEGTVEYVYPSLDPVSRSLKVRLRFDNEKEDLKPNMYADVTVFAKPKKKVLSIPKEALIRTGKNDRVIVAMGEGRFVPMPVNVGMESDKRVEIVSGLGEGDVVVTSSQFLIDSESSLKASLSRMTGRE